MADLLRIDVEGLAELDKRLKALGDDMERDILREALRESMNAVRDRAKEYVPVRKGKLRRSIRVSVNRRALKRGVVRVDLTAGGKPAFYSHMVEFGTASYYFGKGVTVGKPYKIKPTAKGKKALLFGGKVRQTVTHPGSRPQPFMTPASEMLEGEAIRIFASEVRKRLMKYEVSK